MVYFATSTGLNKKILWSFTIIAIFGIGMFIYFQNEHLFANYKSYYLKSYSYVIPYNLKEMVISGHVMGDSTTTEQYARSIPVLLYHGVLGGPATSDNEGEATNIDLATFWDQMKTLKENGWQTITMQDFYDFMQGTKKLPPKSFLLTFDDGRKDSYYPADPILRSLDYHAVMFVIDKYSLEGTSNYYLSLDELKKMASTNEWEIQSHGYSSHSNYFIDDQGNKGHFFSNKLWLSNFGRVESVSEFSDRTRNDLLQSKINLQETFGKPIIAFAFPFGDYGYSTVNFPDAEKTIVPIAENIYPLNFYQYSNNYRYSQNYPLTPSQNSFMIKRIGISPHWSGNDLIKEFNSGQAKTLPFSANFTNVDGWINTNWGTMTLENNKMVISALPDGTGSTVVLDGTDDWTDYEISAQVRWIKGNNIYLSSRYADDKNLTACNFKNDLVHIEQVKNGEDRVIAGNTNSYNPGQSQFRIGMRVVARSVQCLINGNVITQTDFLDPSLSHGGIGIKTWDATPGNSQVEIDNLTVKAIEP